MCAVTILRSPYAHARIVAVDTKKAEAQLGVVAVLTGAEVESNTNTLPSAADPTLYGGKGVKVYALPTKDVRYVGEAVAAIVAEDRYTAERARELVEVTYEELPSVTDPEEAMKPGSPLVEASWPDNVMMHKEFVCGDVAHALNEAEGRVSGTAKAQRYVAAPIEPRAYAANYDPYQDQLTMWSATQNVIAAEEARVKKVQPERPGSGNSVSFPRRCIGGPAARDLATAANRRRPDATAACRLLAARPCARGSAGGLSRCSSRSSFRGAGAATPPGGPTRAGEEISSRSAGAIQPS